VGCFSVVAPAPLRRCARTTARPVSREVVVCLSRPRVCASARPFVKRSVRPAVLRVVPRCPLRAFSVRRSGGPERRAAEFSARGSGPFASAPPSAFLRFRPFCAPRALMRPAPLRSNRASRRVPGSSLRDGRSRNSLRRSPPSAPVTPTYSIVPPAVPLRSDAKLVPPSPSRCGRGPLEPPCKTKAGVPHVGFVVIFT